LFNPDPKYKSQLVAKTCRDVAQQGESKGWWKELTEQANNPNFFFFWIFPGISQKALVGIKLFYFFVIFFIFFSEQGLKKMQPQKLAPTTEVGCGLQKYSKFSKKRVKSLTIFSLFSWIFLAILINQTGRSRVWVDPNWCQEAAVKILDFSDKRAKSYACFTEGISSYVFRKTQYDS
jgi:hypothetical protein